MAKKNSPDHPVNVASVKQISPFRYPGGKTWMVPYVRDFLATIPKPTVSVEPFLGGGSISMAIAHEELAGQAVMVELDPDVAAVWSVICDTAPADAQALMSRIGAFHCTEANARAVLDGPCTGRVDMAFRTIVRNRVQRGGILAPGASLIKAGENGKGVASRWYPDTLNRRIGVIQAMSGRLDFRQGDAFAVIAEFSTDPEAFFFVDPPYTAGGKRAGSRLYAQAQLDHDALFRDLSNVAGTVMMTYDDAPEVLDMAAKYGFRVERIAMKNAHHTTMKEVVLTKAAAPKVAHRNAA